MNISHVRSADKGKGAVLTTCQPENLFPSNNPGWYKSLHFPGEQNHARGHQKLVSGQARV